MYADYNLISLYYEATKVLRSLQRVLDFAGQQSREEPVCASENIRMSARVVFSHLTVYSL